MLSLFRKKSQKKTQEPKPNLGAIVHDALETMPQQRRKSTRKDDRRRKKTPLLSNQEKDGEQRTKTSEASSGERKFLDHLHNSSGEGLGLGINGANSHGSMPMTSLEDPNAQVLYIPRGANRKEASSSERSRSVQRDTQSHTKDPSVNESVGSVPRLSTPIEQTTTGLVSPQYISENAERTQPAQTDQSSLRQAAPHGSPRKKHMRRYTNIMVAGHRGVGKTNLVRSLAATMRLEKVEDWEKIIMFGTDASHDGAVVRPLSVDVILRDGSKTTVSFLDTDGLAVPLDHSEIPGGSAYVDAQVDILLSTMESAFNRSIVAESQVIRSAASETYEGHLHLLLYMIHPASLVRRETVNDPQPLDEKEEAIYSKEDTPYPGDASQAPGAFSSNKPIPETPVSETDPGSAVSGDQNPEQVGIALSSDAPMLQSVSTASSHVFPSPVDTGTCSSAPSSPREKTHFINAPAVPSAIQPWSHRYNEQTELGLSDMDMRNIQRLSARAHVLPVLARCDTLTRTELDTARHAIARSWTHMNLDGEWIPGNDAPVAPIVPSPEEIVASGGWYSDTFPEPFPLRYISAEHLVSHVDGSVRFVREFVHGSVDILHPLYTDVASLSDMLLDPDALSQLKDYARFRKFEPYRTQKLILHRISSSNSGGGLMQGI